MCRADAPAPRPRAHGREYQAAALNSPTLCPRNNPPPANAPRQYGRPPPHRGRFSFTVSCSCRGFQCFIKSYDRLSLSTTHPGALLLAPRASTLFYHPERPATSCVTESRLGRGARTGVSVGWWRLSGASRCYWAEPGILFRGLGPGCCLGPRLAYYVLRLRRLQHPLRGPSPQHNTYNDYSHPSFSRGIRPFRSGTAARRGESMHKWPVPRGSEGTSQRRSAPWAGGRSLANYAHCNWPILTWVRSRACQRRCAESCAPWWLFASGCLQQFGRHALVRCRPVLGWDWTTLGHVG